MFFLVFLAPGSSVIVSEPPASFFRVLVYICSFAFFFLSVSLHMQQIQKVGLLFTLTAANVRKATTDDSEPAPGYILAELASLLFFYSLFICFLILNCCYCYLLSFFLF